MLHEIWTNIAEKHPLVHCITNYVTVNQCANVLLAAGGAPVMADEPEDAADIAAISSALVINIGTLNQNTIPAMFRAGEVAKAQNHPMVLDPVGAGASALRTVTALRLMEALPFTVIRGNLSEIKTIATGSGATRGVDADAADSINEETLPKIVSFAKALAEKTGAVIAISGAIDVVADAQKAYVIKNGHPMMARITGSGCMLSVLIGAAIGANPKEPLLATATAVMAMGYCGEVAEARMREKDAGNATFCNELIDAVFRLDGAMLEAGANFEVR